MYLSFKLAIHLAISIAIGCLIQYLLRFQIPGDLKGWLMISVITPFIASLLSTSTWLSTLQHSFVYSHTWDGEVNGDEIIDWMSIYMMKHKVWSYENLTKIIHNSKSIWWNDDDWKTRPQIFELPSGWVLFTYQGHYLLADYPYPIVQHRDHHTYVTSQITIKSFHQVDWKQFVEDIRDYYYDNLESNKMSYYRINSSYFNEHDRQIIPIRRGASIDSCFGDPVKEKLWKMIIDFLQPEKKKHFLSLNQPPKTSVLVYGPPGTGKTELLYQLASYTWKDYHKPIYILNPRGLDDSELEDIIDKIQSGYVLVNEWDLALSKGSKKKDGGDDDEKEKDSDDSDYPSVKAWLDILDQTQGEVVFWFTTNNYEKLAKINDGALVREGRIDHQIKFDLMTPDHAKNALRYFTNDQEEIIDGLDDAKLEGLTIAKIIKHLKYEYPLEDLEK